MKRPRRSRLGTKQAFRDTPDPRSRQLRGFVLLDSAGVIRRLDVRAAAFLGTDALHAVGLPFIVFVEQGDWRKFFAHLHECRSHAGGRVVDVCIRRRNAKSVVVQLRSEPVMHRTMNGLRLRTALMLETERQMRGNAHRDAVGAREQETRSAARQLGTSDRDSAVFRLPRVEPSHSAARDSPAPELLEPGGQLLGTVAHELRNALVPLMMGVPVLRSTPGSEATQRLYEMMERQVARMDRMVSDLLDVTRTAHGKIRLEPRRLELNQLVRSVIDDHRAQFELRGVTLDAACSSEPVHIVGDPVRLVQVLGNLLQNALKFTDRHGQVKASVEVQGKRAVLRVRDTGAGIAPESIARLFTPFVQAEATIGRNRSGLGIGLALVKSLIEMHGGTVTAASAGLGRGAEFTVRLPLARQVRAPRSGALRRVDLSVA